MFNISYSGSSFENEVRNHQQNMGYVPSDTYISIAGNQCISKANFYETMKIHMNFPEYFSFNWDSFNDCIFDFIMQAESNVLIHFSSMKILLSENNQDRQIFLEIMEDLAQNKYPKKVSIVFSD